MFSSRFSLQDYCQRIGYTGTLQPDIATLGALMRCQLQTIPFENLDVLTGQGVNLEPDALVAKLLHAQRGGYCYEVNGLFAMVLQALGVAYQFVAARPMFYPVKRPKTHMALVVTLEGQRWLFDLGFGSYGPRAPVCLDFAGQPVQQEDDRFVLECIGEVEYILKAWVNGDWANQYGFNLCPQEWIDFAPANYLNSHHPDAIFVQKPLIIRHTPRGRIILLGARLKTYQQGVLHERDLEQGELNAVLQTVFGLPALIP